MQLLGLKKKSLFFSSPCFLCDKDQLCSACSVSAGKGHADLPPCQQGAEWCRLADQVKRVNMRGRASHRFLFLSSLCLDLVLSLKLFIFLFSCFLWWWQIIYEWMNFCGATFDECVTIWGWWFLKKFTSTGLNDLVEGRSHWQQALVLFTTLYCLIMVMTKAPSVGHWATLFPFR